MSISYSSIVGFGSGKTTLPSVETWGQNMNILRDPPKAIFTRKIDKVGETSEITQMIDDSSDRACEAILLYPRGVNPMVAVSFDNYGNNGGQKSGSINQSGLNISGGNKQAYLPRRIMNGGAFRPPVRDQRDILPLSRLPRVWTSSFSQPGFTDFSKKAICQSDTGKEYRNIKKAEQLLRGCIRPTATYQLETPILENYEVKHVIKNPLHVSGHSGIEPGKKINGEMGVVTKILENPLHVFGHSGIEPGIKINGEMGVVTKILENPLKAFGQTQIQPNIKFNSEMGAVTKINHNPTRAYGQSGVVSAISKNGEINTRPKINETILHPDINVNQKGDYSKDVDVSNLDTDKYIQEALYSEVVTKNSQNITLLSLEDIYGVDTVNRTKHNINIDYQTPQTSYDKTEYIHSDIELERTLPYYQSITNQGYNIHKNIENQVIEREYNPLRPVSNAYTNIGTTQIINNTPVNRDYNLRPTITPGGFNPVPTMPLVYRANTIQEFDTEKSKLRKNVYDMQQDRHLTMGKMFE
jgi:hypothetical protein